MVHGDAASSTCRIASIAIQFLWATFHPLKNEKTIHQPSPLQKKKDETFNLHLIGIAAVAVMQCSSSGAMSQGVGQLQCLLVGIWKLQQAAQKIKQQSNCAAWALGFLIGTSGHFNNIVCPIVHHAWWPYPAHCLQFFGGQAI